MDKSETYIKMCEKAEKIRVLWKPADWDYCYCKKNKEVAVLSGYDTDAGFYGHSAPAFSNPFGGKLYWHDFFCSGIDTLEEYKEQHIWLPTQSQLQEMVYGTRGWNDTPAGWLETFAVFCNQDIVLPPSSPSPFPSKAQREEDKRNEPKRRAYVLGQTKHREYVGQFSSMEQLWLAFVMKEKYQKVWNGEDWVKEE